MVDRSVTVRLRAEISDYQRKLGQAAASTSAWAKSLDSADGRMANLVQTGLALGPALVPIGAVAVPAIAGLTAGLGAAAGAAGVTLLAFEGMGDALKALNDYQLEKTPENLEKVQQAMAQLSPTGRQFARTLQDLRPEIHHLQNLAQEGMFPGMTEGLEELEELGPRFEQFVSTTAATVGQLAAEAGDSLNDDEWVEFFDYINTEGRQILLDMGHTLGNVTEGVAHLLMGLDPLTDQFGQGLLEASRDFKEWSQNLEDDQGFQSFLDYVERVGPKAVDTVGALVDALAAIVAAAAPVGEVSLPVIKALAGALEAIAESPAGPALVATAAGLSAVSRAMALYKAANGSALGAFLGKAGKDGGKAGLGFRGAAAGAGILALSLTDLDDKMGLSNTAMFAAMGLMAGPWGAAIGAGIGFTLDLAAANDSLEAAISGANDAMDTGSIDQMIAKRQELQDILDEQNQSGMAAGDWSLGDGMNFLKGQINDLTGASDEARSKISELDREIAGGMGTFSMFGHTVDLVGDSFRVAAGDANAFSDALAELSGWLDKRQALINYNEAIGQLAKGLKDGFNREDREQIIQTGRSILEVADSIKNKDLRADFLAGARASLEKLAERSGPKAAAEIERLITHMDTLGLTHAEPTVDVNTGQAEAGINQVDQGMIHLRRSRAEPTVNVKAAQAIAALQSVRQWLNNLDGDSATTTVITRHINVAGPRGDINSGGVADGGTIGGQRQPYGDKHLYMLAPGEEVISNRRGQADRHRALLKKINAGLADGGTPGGSWAGTSWAQPGPYMGVNGLSPALSGVGELRDALRMFTKQLDEATKAVDREKRQRDELIAASEAFAAAVGGAYAKADLFSGGLSDFDAGVEANTNDTNAANAALAAAAAQGLDGGLYQALAASGNLQLLQEFAGLSAEQIEIREQQFATQSSAQSALAGSAVDAAGFTAAIKEQTKELKEAQKERQKYAALVKEVERRLDQLPDRVEKGARAGVGDRDRDTATRIRTGAR